MTPKEKLIAHSDEFRKELFQIADNIYFAVGYGASNVTLLVGETSLIVVDTLESTGAAEVLLADLRQISDKPIETIIYTHSHRDHVSGATVFAADQNPTIIARPPETNMLGAKEVAAISRLRAKRQFAIGEPSWVRINLGLGPGERPLKGLGAGIVPANKLVEGNSEVHHIDGFELHFISAPGETPDTMLVWLPQQRVLIGADNYYKSFPNLYPIRGSAYRDVALWVQSLDKMMGLNAETLLPGHSRPLFGADQIREVLTNYRDGINHILQETLAGINRGMTIEELVQTVKLPPHLADKPYLQEFYGSVAWSVRAIFTGYLGWFDGNPTNMFPLSPQAEAAEMADLAGGVDGLLAKAEEAVANGRFQWTLQLADHLIALEQHVDKATALKVAALTALADQQINATARHYYLTVAHEMKNGL
ncbi:MAG: alkyl/aryl-sulfatase [Chloroflexota bacterium]